MTELACRPAAPRGLCMVCLPLTQMLLLPASSPSFVLCHNDVSCFVNDVLDILASIVISMGRAVRSAARVEGVVAEVVSCVFVWWHTLGRHLISLTTGGARTLFFL